MRPNFEKIKEAQQVLWDVHTFHPDFRYDQETRALKDIQHSSAMWLEWEATIFDPEDYPLVHRRYMDFAEKHGKDLWNFGAVEFRKVALFATTSLCLYEYSKLVEQVSTVYGDEGRVDPKIQTPAELWKHLYWFTRFF